MRSLLSIGSPDRVPCWRISPQAGGAGARPGRRAPEGPASEGAGQSIGYLDAHVLQLTVPPVVPVDRGHVRSRGGVHARVSWHGRTARGDTFAAPAPTDARVCREIGPGCILCTRGSLRPPHCPPPATLGCNRGSPLSLADAPGSEPAVGMPVTNPSKLAHAQYLRRMVSEARQAQPLHAAGRRKPAAGAARRCWLWFMLAVMFSAFASVRLMEQAELRQTMFHGASAGFKQDGSLRDPGTRLVASDCEAIFATDWRFEILRFAERGGVVLPGSVYVFGVFNGRSTKILRQLFPSSATWGFDSFEGLPDETDPEPIRVKGHGPGAFRTSHDAYTLRESILTDEANPTRSWSGKKRKAEIQLRQAMAGWGGMVIPTGQLELKAGWFEDALENELAVRLGMAPAAYIDVDVNLFSSTLKALDWMFSSGLVQEGTLIGYEGFWSVACVAHGAGHHSDPLQTASGRAHREIAKTYGVQFACVAGPCGTKQPPDDLDVCTRNGAVIFQVKSLRDTAKTDQLGATMDESGFTMSGAEITAYKYGLRQACMAHPAFRHRCYVRLRSLSC